MRILYSFNKTGFEAEYWPREIAAASTAQCQFVPFNHGEIIPPARYLRAQALDDLYFARDAALMRLYAAFEDRLAAERIDAVLVDNCFPYHPDFLRGTRVYRVLRTSDGPISAYDRDFAYLHAYHQVLYHSPAYSRDMSMAEKLRYCGAANTDFWPLALFDTAFDSARTDDTLPDSPRDIDVVFVGALHVNKMPLLATVKRAFGRRCVLRGLSSVGRNMYFNVKYGYPGWVRPLDFTEYVPLYRRAKIGFNVHNRGDYTVGSYRLFDLPGNGVMQISDGGPYLDSFFAVGDEIVSYETADDLVDKIRYYLAHDDERRRIARNGLRRVLRDHRFAKRMQEAADLIARGMERIGWSGVASC